MDPLSFGLGALATLLVMGILRFVNDQGHSVFGVKDKSVQNILGSIITKYTTSKRWHPIHIGPSHQRVFSQGTVLAYFDENPEVADLPRNIRSFVVRGKGQRREAAQALVRALTAVGCITSLHDLEKPLSLPHGTFILVVSDGFLDCAVAFRPHWTVMGYHQIRGVLKRVCIKKALSS